MDFNETKVSDDDYKDFKRFMFKILSICKRYKCCQKFYNDFEDMMYTMELLLDRNLGE